MTIHPTIDQQRLPTSSYQQALYQQTLSEKRRPQKDDLENGRRIEHFKPLSTFVAWCGKL